MNTKDLLFSQAREGFFSLEAHISSLKSEITRKECEITRLRTPPGSLPQQQQQQKEVILPVVSRGIFTNHDLASFLASSTFAMLLDFLQSLCNHLSLHPDSAEALLTRSPVDKLLGRCSDLIDETPIEDADPQRFGNKAFRKWHAKIDRACQEFFPANMEFQKQFSKSFGDPTRLDFGTGHEVAFLMALFTVKQVDLNHIMAVTFSLYFALVRKVRRVYKLEPAGSHGVWSLDDYHFLPFVFGAKQWSLQHEVSPGLFLRRNLQTSNEGTMESDFFSQALLDIFECKRKSAFREHSPLLYQLLSSKHVSWKQLFQGLMNMWVGEVVGKFPVAQHFLFGPSLPITWSATNTKEEEDNDKEEKSGGHHRGEDPLIRYFGISPTTTSDHGNLADTFELAGWTIKARNELKIAGELELNMLTTTHGLLDFPLPEMLFLANKLELSHAGLCLRVSAKHALIGCKDLGNRKLIKVPMSGLWENRVDDKGTQIKTWREDYDWTYTSLDLVESNVKWEPDTLVGIDYDMLKDTSVPILFFKEVCFFEDDLFDLGLSKFTGKMRVMPTCMFLLARLFVRVDNFYFRVVDCRVFHAFNSAKVVMEQSVREGSVDAIPELKALNSQSMNDSNLVSSLLPLEGPPRLFSIPLLQKQPF